MPSPKRPRIQREEIIRDGGNPHLREPNKPSEQIRITKKVFRKLK